MGWLSRSRAEEVSLRAKRRPLCGSPGNLRASWISRFDLVTGAENTEKKQMKLIPVTTELQPTTCGSKPGRCVRLRCKLCKPRSRVSGEHVATSPVSRAQGLPPLRSRTVRDGLQSQQVLGVSIGCSEARWPLFKLPNCFLHLVFLNQDPFFLKILSIYF